MITKRKYYPGPLLDRVNKICHFSNINMSKLIYDRDCINNIKRKFHQNVSDGLNGIVDSLHCLWGTGMKISHFNSILVSLFMLLLVIIWSYFVYCDIFIHILFSKVDCAHLGTHVCKAVIAIM